MPVSESSPGEDLDAIHREALMDTANLSLSQRRLVADAVEQFRAEDDGQDVVDNPLISVCYYPEGIFAKEGPWILR